MSTFTDSVTLHHAPVVCDACQTVATGVVSGRGRIVSVDTDTIRHRSGIFHAECFGRWVLEQEVDVDGSA